MRATATLFAQEMQLWVCPTKVHPLHMPIRPPSALPQPGRSVQVSLNRLLIFPTYLSLLPCKNILITRIPFPL